MLTPWTDQELPIAPGATLAARVYRGGSSCQILHLHGGAFTGTLEQGQPVARALAAAEATVWSVAYPCGGSHPFPAGIEAVYAALLSVSKARRRQPLLVAGEEAGGNLAAALTLICRDRLGPKLAGQILFSPMLDPRLATCSVRDAGGGPAGCKWAEGWQAYLGSAEKAVHPYAAPALATRLAGLPPALILTGPHDPMQDEAGQYAARLRASLVPVVERRIEIDGDWPDALGQPCGGTPAWAETVRDAVAGFLDQFLLRFPRTLP